MKHIINIIFVAGLMIAIYPMITKVYYNYNASVTATQLEKTHKYKQQDSRYLQQQAYNEALRQSRQHISQPAVERKPKSANQNIQRSDEIIATIKIPKLKLHYPVFDGATQENLNKGVSRVSGTSYPLGGPSSNSVLAAHSYSPLQEWFTHIDRLKNGDEIIINNFRHPLKYVVYDRVVVTPDKIVAMRIQKNKDIITLLTCTPDGLKRLLVYAERVDRESTTHRKYHNEMPVTQKSFIEKLKVLSESWYILLIISIFIYLFIRMKLENRNEVGT